MTPRLRAVYSRVTHGTHPGCARVRPNYVRACTCPCPAMSTQSTRVAPSRPRRIRCTVGLRLHAGSAPTSCQGYCQVARGWSTGYALVTPWRPNYTRATPGAPRGHTRVARQSCTGHAQSTPGLSLVTPGRPPERTRVTPESPGGSAGGRGGTPCKNTSGDTSSDTPETPKWRPNGPGQTRVTPGSL